MTPQDFINLYEKFTSGKCTPEEIELLETHRDSFQLKDLPWSTEMGNKQQIEDEILNKLNNRISSAEKKTLSKIRWFAAAAAIVVFTFSLIIYHQVQPSPDKITKNPSLTNKSPVVPGFNKATLTLSDGSNIDLNDSKKGLLSKQGGASVGKLSDGKLVYNAKDADAKKAVTLYNTITTPRGGQYQVVLSDGTKVWLNAASSLKFPAIFTGSERKVELTGEAYFEVAKNKNKPFKIAVNNMGIEVLGTHFNVNAYKDEEAINTTLLEGSVKLVTANHEAYLKPGQQASLGQQQTFDVHRVNTEEAVAWKNGYFMFNNENIQGIMRKISRWYDVEVVYEGKIDEKDFGGTVSRFDSAADVLKSLELTGTVHFKIEGRRITVMP